MAKKGGKKGGSSPKYSPTYGTGTGYRDAGANAFRYMPAAGGVFANPMGGYGPASYGASYVPGASPLALPMWQPTMTTVAAQPTATNPAGKVVRPREDRVQESAYAWTPPANLSEDDWLRMTQGYNPYNAEHPEWGGYYTGQGLDYGLSPLNLQRAFADQKDLAAAGLGNTLNAYGQPIGTLAPIQRQRQFSARTQYAAGTTPVTSENLNEMYTQTGNYLANWQPRGRSGSYASALNYRQRDLLKRRKGVIEALAKANGIDLGGGGQGIAPAWTGVMANWRV